MQGRTAYRMLSQRVAWKKAIRPDALAQSGQRCAVCGSDERPLTCHEKWKYDDKQRTSTLEGFEAHCRNCDSVAHAGRAINEGYGEIVLAHLCRVNGCKPEEAAHILVKAFQKWDERSEKEWNIAVTPALLKTYPELRELPSVHPARTSS